MTRSLAAAAFIALWLVFVACGDDDDDDSVADGIEITSPFQVAVAQAQERLTLLGTYAYTSNLEFELPGAGAELGATTGSVEAAGEAIPPDSLHQLATSTLGDISAEEEVVRLSEGDFVRRESGYQPGLGELNTYLVSVPSLWDAIASVAGFLPEDPDGKTDTLAVGDALHYVVEDVRLLFVKDMVLRLFGAVDSAAALPDRYRLELWLSEDESVLLRAIIEGADIDPDERLNTFHLEAVITDIGGDFEITID